MNRRHFIATTSIAAAGIALSQTSSAGTAAKPAVLGGPKLRRTPFSTWPVYDETDEKQLQAVLRSGRWYRGNGTKVAEFEKSYQGLTGAKHCIATSSGTTALLSAVGALGLGPGDEVILPPYTFIATYNVAVNNYALPVFVDSDPESFQIDAAKVNAAITKATRVILPVHIGGNVADLDTLLAAAKTRGVAVIEDACQAHLAEWRGRVVGNWGLAGCSSFQASKNLTSGEGGAVICNDDAFAEKVYIFQGQGRPRSSVGYHFTYAGDRAANYRLPEFQAGLLLAQMTRLSQQFQTREENASYLTRLLGEIPGIKPARLHEGTTRTSRLLLMARYQKEHFANLDRSKFLAALSAEGIPCTPGYGPLNLEQNVQALAANRCYLRIYGKRTMARWVERNRCPVNDKLCAEALWFPQNVLLGSKSDMDQVAEAIRKIQAGAADIAKAG